MKTSLLALATALALTGCSGDLPAGWLIDHDRALGAGVEVDGDPGAAWPAPGETATVRWIMASPAGPPERSWLFTLCPALDTGSVDLCAGPPLATFADRGVVPAISFAAPAE